LYKKKQMTVLETAQRFYERFNQKDWQAMADLVAKDLIREPNQGEPRYGIEAFRAFMAMMDECYQEQLTNIEFYVNQSQTKVACQFIVNGIYKKGEDGLPEAKSQPYVLPAASFLAFENGKISKISTHYNLPLWISLVS
jgi:steroid delta-isomerase-like uncharacterized protein